MNIRSNIILNIRYGRIKIQLLCINIGFDVLIILSSHSSKHIGAVSVINTLINNQKQSNNRTTYTISTNTHKEKILNNISVYKIQASILSTICVICGIHIDHASHEEINDITCMIERIINLLICQLTNI